MPGRHYPLSIKHYSSLRTQITLSIPIRLINLHTVGFEPAETILLGTLRPMSVSQIWISTLISLKRRGYRSVDSNAVSVGFISGRILMLYW